MRPNNPPDHPFNPSRRWCSNHMGDAPVEGGEWVVTGKTRRWLCSTCLERKAQRMASRAAPTAL